MQFKMTVGICQISIYPNADRTAYEETMKKKNFPKVEVGKQTRGGIVTAQYLLKNESVNFEYNYAWVFC